MSVKTQRIVPSPQSLLAMQRGIRTLALPMRATLGPLGGHVLSEYHDRGRAPEILDNGGDIARRVIALEDRDADVGAMLLRHVVTRLATTVGDFTATAAVLFSSVFDAGVTHIHAGANPMLLRRCLDEELRAILDLLSEMATPLQGQEQLTRLAYAVCHDETLASTLGEVFDIVGEYGRVEIRVGSGRGAEHEYLEGAYWTSGVLSRQFFKSDAQPRVELTRPAVLLTDLEFKDLAQLQPVLESAIRAGYKSLVVVALKVSDPLVAMLVTNFERFPAIVVRTPGGNLGRTEAIEDMEALLGGRPFLKASGDSMARVCADDLASARQAWADRDYVGFVGGGADPRRFRQHIKQLRSAFSRSNDPTMRRDLQERIGRLSGGSATLRVGGLSLADATQRKGKADRAANTLRGALREGVVPGGGAALFACLPHLEKRLRSATYLEQRAACSILMSALQAPMRAILLNAGYEADSMMANVRAAPHGTGFDVLAGDVAYMVDHGIADNAYGYRSAVNLAIGAAAQALTIGVIVHRSNPEEVLDPA